MPTELIGKAEVPKLIMGIHPYDGCSYKDETTDKENSSKFNQVKHVSESLRCAVEEGGITAAQIDHMLPELDRLHLQAIWETQQATQTEIGLVAYILIPIKFDNEMVSYSERAHSTFYDQGEKVAGQAFRDHMANDAIIRYNLGGDLGNLVTPQTVAPYGSEDSDRFTIDYSILEHYLGFFAGLDILIADPGAEIDLLAMTGRFDLIREYIGFLRSRFNTVITSVHHAGITIPLLEQENIPVDGYLTTINKPGTFMLPTPELALDAIQNTDKPIIAIKPMAGGRYLGEKAFSYVFDKIDVSSAMFGMGTVEQVRETTSAARNALGIH